MRLIKLPLLSVKAALDLSSWGAGLVVAEVDCHTGTARVVSADMVIDAGRSLNPAIDVGQVEGAFAQGMGYVTNEQLLYDPETGETITPCMGTYKVSIK